jgi:hypothetical protein
MQRVRVCALALTLGLGLAAPAAAQMPLDLDIRAGASISSFNDTPTGFSSTSSELGYFVGGDVKFGKFFYVQPGFYYQHQSVDLTSGTESDGIGISSIMIPLSVGLDLDLKIVGAQIDVGPTLAFNTSVGDNDFGVTKDDLNNTRVGGLVAAKVFVLFIGAWVGYQFDFTDTVKGGDATLNQWMFGLGVNF